MRTKTVIDGFKNSQKFRVLFKNGGSEYDIGMYMTVQQITEQFATHRARITCWDAMNQLAYLRHMAKKDGDPLPTGLGTTIGNQQIQVDLI